jgi:FAD/FMN-containing dehydrogenase/Fe-S oxidoreductase
VVSIDAERGVAVVQGGLVLDELNARLKPHGLWFPVDVSTSAQATLGGMAGNNSCGSRSIAYGNMVHNVLGAEIALADGTSHAFGLYRGAQGRPLEIGQFVRELVVANRDQIDEHWPRVQRRVGGYNIDVFRCRNERPYSTDGSVNLAHLFVGAEGTLGFTKALTLKLAPLPTHRVLGVANFRSFQTAMDAAQHIVVLGPTAVELVDRTMIELARSNPAFRPVIESALVMSQGKLPEAILLVEFSGEERAPLLGKLADLDGLVAHLNGAGSLVKMPDAAAQKALWEVRKAGLNIMMSLRGDGKPVSFIEDCAVPLKHLSAYTAALTEVFARHGTRGTWYAHASVGTLHVRPILDMRRDGAKKMRAIAEEASALVRKFKGAYSGEHGDGLCRGEWIRWQFGPALDDAFRALKRELDPHNLFCPKRIIDPPKMDDASLFRYPPGYKTIALKPALDWSPWNVQNDARTERLTVPGSGGDNTGGLAKHAEMCNNNGHCRKFDAGTMCPSYRITRDERHVTRGRANTLRLALAGQFGPEGLNHDAVREALDLCVSCKGCKRDCPTGVDMARVKIEVLHADRRKRGLSERDRVIAELPERAWRASRWPLVPAVLNRLAQSERGRAWGEQRFGISTRRSLPRLRRDTLWRRAASLKLASREQVLASEKGVVLFVDSFNGLFESENAVAALRVMQAAGYAVHVPTTPERTPLCCGRTYLATGQVEEAKKRASELLKALLPFTQGERPVPIVGLEPSCLYSLRDEVLAMDLGAGAQGVARQAVMFEAWAAAEAKAGRFAPPLRAPGKPVVVHGHCHQKAFGEMQPVLDVLALLPGVQPTLIESSCCGMAGSFGYEVEHVDVSMQMAELSLLPALRAAPADAIVVADGTSCRHQIADGLQGARRARHVADVLAEYLEAASKG